MAKMDAIKSCSVDVDVYATFLAVFGTSQETMWWMEIPSKNTQNLFEDCVKSLCPLPVARSQSLTLLHHVDPCGLESFMKLA